MVGSLIFLFWFGLGFLPLHGPGYPETHDVDQANLRLTDSPTPSSVRIKGVHHHAQHLLDVLMFCSSDPKASLPGAFLAALGNHFTNLFSFVLFETKVLLCSTSIQLPMWPEAGLTLPSAERLECEALPRKASILN